MKVISIILFSSILLSSVAVAIPVFAVQPPLTSIGGLVPCGNGTGSELNTSYSSSNTASTTACDFAGLVDLIKNITNFLIILSAPIFVGIMVWAGVKLLLSRGNVNELSTVKRVLKDTIIAFVVILAGWLIVHFIATAFLNPVYNMFMP